MGNLGFQEIIFSLFILLITFLVPFLIIRLIYRLGKKQGRLDAMKMQQHERDSKN
jgi:hypothetical protein